jgi:hypothetical protein
MFISALLFWLYRRRKARRNTEVESAYSAVQPSTPPDSRRGVQEIKPVIPESPASPASEIQGRPIMELSADGARKSNMITPVHELHGEDIGVKRR